MIVMQDKGKVLAIDLGEKRIGLALSDATRTIAAAYGALARKSRSEDFQRYERLIKDEDIKLIVMGLPLTAAGEEGQRSAWVRDYTAELQKNITVPIVFWDERFSTKRAEESLRARGKRGRDMKDSVDAVAAAIFLQEYLDVHSHAV